MAFFSRKQLIIIIETGLIIAVYLLAKTWSERNLVTGIAPPINANSLAGHPVSLNDFRGGPLLIHFWASWCPVCKLEQDNVQSISEDYPVMTIAMQSGNELEIATYMKENKLRFPVIIDEQGELAERFGVHGVPTSFILSPGGTIVFSEAGYTTEIGLRSRLWLAGE